MTLFPPPAPLRRCLFRAAAVLALVAFFGAAAGAQTTSTSSQHLPSSPIGGDHEDRDWFGSREVQEKLQRTREKERYRRIVDDANRLVTLTALYRKSLEEHGTPTQDDQKLLAQIEKLAREVKDRMRGM